MEKEASDDTIVNCAICGDAFYAAESAALGLNRKTDAGEVYLCCSHCADVYDHNEKSIYF